MRALILYVTRHGGGPFVCLFVCLFGLRTPVVCGGLRLTKDGTYAIRGARPQGQADAVLFVRRIPAPPLVRAPGGILRFRAHAPTELGVCRSTPCHHT